MMPDYKFQAEKFAITDDNLHLLRNGFNYETIPLSAVSAVEIIDGKDLKNWIMVAGLGFVLTGYAFYDILQLIIWFNSPASGHIYIQRIVVPLIPMLLGLYSLRIAFRNTRVMVVRAGSKRYYFSLREIIKRNEFLQYLNYLKTVYPSFQNLSK